MEAYSMVKTLLHWATDAAKNVNANYRLVKHLSSTTIPRLDILK